MRKFIYKEMLGLSNTLGARGCSYKFVPEKEYNYDDGMSVFIDDHPDRFIEVIEEVNLPELNKKLKEEIKKIEEKIINPNTNNTFSIIVDNLADLKDFKLTQETIEVESKSKDVAEEINEIVNSETDLEDSKEDDDEPKPIIDEEIIKEDLDSKEVYLKDLHWQKLKKLCEKFGIKYNKDTALQELKKLSIQQLLGE